MKKKSKSKVNKKTRHYVVSIRLNDQEYDRLSTAMESINRCTEYPAFKYISDYCRYVMLYKR